MNSSPSHKLLVGIIAFLIITAWSPLSESQSGSNIDPVERWAWGTNIGWLNMRPTDGGVTVFIDHLEGWAWGENVGWVRLGTAAAGTRHHYPNTSPDNYGVNRDVTGTLSGFAWSSNVGWINFAPTHGGVTVDLLTGEFDGYAWAENAGWISVRGDGSVPYMVVVQELILNEIPTLGYLGLVLLAVLLAGAGVSVLKRVAI